MIFNVFLLQLHCNSTKIRLSQVKNEIPQSHCLSGFGEFWHNLRRLEIKPPLVEMTDLRNVSLCSHFPARPPNLQANSVPDSPLFAKNTSPECFLNAQSLPEVQVLHMKKKKKQTDTRSICFFWSR